MEQHEGDILIEPRRAMWPNESMLFVLRAVFAVTAN